MLHLDPRLRGDDKCLFNFLSNSNNHKPMKTLKTNWLIKHTLTVFSCVLIIVLGIATLTYADPVTTTIGENIATNDLSVTGNVTSGTWQGTTIGTQYGGTGQDFSGSTGILKITAGTASMITDSSTNWDTAYTYSQVGHLPLAGGTLTGGLTVDGVTGLVDADIPDTITASNYLPLAGGTLTADLILQEAGDAKLTIYSNTDSPAADSKLFVIQKGTTPSELFSVDEDGDVVVANDLAVTGNITSGTWQGDLIATEYGGTGADWSEIAQGNLPYFSAEGALSNLAPGTAGQFLKSQGTGADPEWANVTRSATFVVAANDSSTLSKQQADYVCDGTDDQEEIQAAITALPDGGGKVVLMEGHYYTASAIFLKSNLTIEGMGWNSIVENMDNTWSDKQTFQFLGSGPFENVVIRDLKILGQPYTTGPPAGGSGDNIFLNELTNGIVESCYIANAGEENIFITDCNNIHIRNNIFVGGETSVEIKHGCDNIRVYNNTILDTGPSGGEPVNGLRVGSRGGPTPYPTNIKVYDNIISGSSGTGLYIRDIGVGCEFYNNAFYDIAGTGIYITGTNEAFVIKNCWLDEISNVGLYLLTNNVAVYNCTINNCGDRGIYATANNIIIDGCNILNSTAEGIRVDGSNNNIINNKVESCSYGIYLLGDYNKISNNYIQDNDDSGILVKSADNCIVTNNICINNDADATGYRYDIDLDESSTKNIVKDNLIRSTNTRYGIYMRGTTSDNVIDGNDVRDTGTHGKIKDDTGNNTIMRNLGYTTENSGTSTGTGAQQTIAHGLATTPTKVILWNIENGANPYQSAAADATNIYITAVDTLDYGWQADAE